MNVVSINPLSEPRWTALIERFDASVFHSPSWLKALQQTYNFEIGAVIAMDDATTPVGGIAFSIVDNFLGKRAVALPFSDHFDPLTEDRGVWNALVAKIAEMALPFTIRCVHNTMPLADDHFVAIKKANWQGMRIDANAERLWCNFKGSLQRNLRKALREGVTVTASSDLRALQDFYAMHVRIRKSKYRMLAQPFGFFRNIRDNFIQEDRIKVFVAYYDQQAIAASVFLGWGKTLYYKFGASDPRYLIHRPNDLIMWEAIKFAAMNGYRYLDFGLSDSDQEGLIRFKQRFGTEEKEIVHLTSRWHRSDGHYSTRIKQRFLMKLSRLLTERVVPNAITERGGKLLYQFFS